VRTPSAEADLAVSHRVVGVVVRVGFQNSACACDLRRSAFHATGMITDVPLRLLYLILDRFLGWLMLLGAQRHPKTSSSSSCATRSRYCGEPTPRRAWTGPTEPCSPHSSDASPRNRAVIAWSPRPRSYGGTAAW
jgi:hypothetical protein